MELVRRGAERWRVLGKTLCLELRLRRLRREEDSALERAGRTFCAVTDAGPWTPPVAGALARVVARQEQDAALARRLEASLEGDRRDYRSTSAELGRGLIVARGLLERMVLRHAAWGARHEPSQRLVELGAAVLAEPSAAAALPEAERARAAGAQRALREARAERDALLAPLGGRALPRPVQLALHELSTFLGFVREELHKRILLRLPSLAAMGAAWCVTHRFATSRHERWLNQMLGRDAGLSEEALERLVFWLPLLSAALVAYLVYTLRRFARRRYLGLDPAPQGHERASGR